MPAVAATHVSLQRVLRRMCTSSSATTAAAVTRHRGSARALCATPRCHAGGRDMSAPCVAATTTAAATDETVVTTTATEAAAAAAALSASSSPSPSPSTTAEAVCRLRAALQVLSEVEVAKALQRSDLPPLPSATSSSSSPSTTTTTMGWIRNKRPKFWALVRVATLARNNSGTASPVAGVVVDDSHASGLASSPLSTPSSSTATTAAQDAVAQPLRSHYKRDVAHALSALLDRDAALGSLLLERLSADSRRLLLVMGTASEYFGAGYEKVAEQVKQADRDGDDAISATDYDEWARHSYQLCKQRQQQPPSSPSSSSVCHGGSVDGVVTVSGSGHGTSVVPATPTSSARIVQVLQRSVPLATTSATTPATATVTESACARGRLRRLAARVAAAWHATRRRLTHARSRSPSSHTSTSTTTAATTTAAAAATTITTTTATAATAAGGSDGKADYIPWRTYVRLLLVAGTPFLAFGALDNTTLVLAGDTIDRTMSQAFGLSSMAAAGLGGVVSGVAGIQVHSLAERYTRAAPPALTAAQRRSRSYERAEHWGNTLGMTLGLVLGMLPLLFLAGGSATTEAKLRQDHDRLLREAERSRQRRLKALMHEQQSTRADVVAAQARAWRALQSDMAAALAGAASDTRDEDVPIDM